MKALFIEKRTSVVCSDTYAAPPEIVEVEQSEKGFRKFFPKGEIKMMEVYIISHSCRLYYIDSSEYKDNHPMVFKENHTDLGIYSSVLIVCDDFEDARNAFSWRTGGYRPLVVNNRG